MNTKSTLYISLMQLWDLDDLLKDSEKTPTSQAAVADSDSDEMDVEFSHPKSNKGIPGILQNFM